MTSKELTSADLQTPFILYGGDDDKVHVRVFLKDETIWLPQRAMAELFDTSPDNIGLHLKNIFADEELDEGSTAEDFSVVQNEGGRSVRRTLKFYNLDAIIAVGYRVNSRRATQFRIWATRILKEFIKKGFVLDADNNVKNSFIDGDWIESPYITDKGVRLIQTGNIAVGKFKDKSKRYISLESFSELKCTEVKIGDVLICRLAEPAGRACLVPNLGAEKMITSVDVTIIKTDGNKIVPYYLVQFFSMSHTLNIIESLCGGSTRSRVSRTNLGNIKIKLPPIAEQQKIAAVLFAADTEIETHQKQLAALKEQKKGLMQQLLTGKKRVKVDSHV